MKSKLIIAAIILCCSISAMAQPLDVIHLKNGSIIRGTIIEYVPNESFAIKSNSNIFVYEVKDIAKISREENQNNNNIYDFCPEIGYLTNVNRELDNGHISTDVAKINLNNLFNINSNISVGGGIGINYYFTKLKYSYSYYDYYGRFVEKTEINDNELWYFSIYASGKFKPFSTTPIFFETKLGYSFFPKNDFDDIGELFSFGGGYDFNNWINLSLQYEYQNFDNSDNGYHLLGLVVGFTF